MIRVSNVTKIYESALGVQTKCLNEANLELKRGRINALCGASGSGKTTLLNIIGLLDSPTGGEVYYDDIELSEINEFEKFRLENIGIIFQKFNLLNLLTVEENVLLPLDMLNLDVDEEYYNNLLSVLGLEELLNKFPQELSGGQQQRVAIARALINKPRIVLADEPTGNLDKDNSEIVIQLLLEISNKLNQTILIITHDRDIAKMCDTVFYIEDGVVYEE